MNKKDIVIKIFNFVSFLFFVIGIFLIYIAIWSKDSLIIRFFLSGIFSMFVTLILFIIKDIYEKEGV